MCGSPGDVSEAHVMQEKRKKVKQRKGWSDLSVTSPTSQLILQPFRRFTYGTAHSPTLTLLHLRHSSLLSSPTSQALHLRHLASRPWCYHAFVSNHSVKPPNVSITKIIASYFINTTRKNSVDYSILLLCILRPSYSTRKCENS